MNHVNDTYKIQGVLVFLLLLASLIWRGTSNLSLLSLSCSCILLTAVSCFLLIHSRTTLSWSILSILLIFWLGWISVPPALGWVSNKAIPGFFQCSVWVMAFFIFSLSSSPERLWSIFIKSIWLLAVISACYALIQIFIHHEMPAGFFASKNTGAAFLMLAVLLLSGELIMSPSKLETKSLDSASAFNTYNICLGWSIYLITLAMLTSLSRGVLLSFLLFITLELLLLRKYASKKRIYLVLLIFFASFLSLSIFAQPAILHRLDVLQQEKSRFIIWEGAWHLWQQAPLYGIGISNFSHYYPAFSLPGDGSSLQYVHNDFLQLLIETGVPGILILLALVGTLSLAFYSYLKNKQTHLQTRVRVIACFSALGAFATHSIVDFNFYVLSMNLILGCCLGYLHSEFIKKGNIWGGTINSSPALRNSLYIFAIICLVPMCQQALNLLMLDYYSEQSSIALKQQDYNRTLMFNKKALAWFESYDVHSYQADAYFQLANQAQVADKDRLVTLMKNEIHTSLKANPYYARAYFQRAVLQAVLENSPIKAATSFQKALKNDPHFCLARITYTLFLIDKNELMTAQQILEQGLVYPIVPEYAEQYLNYLAKLRATNGDKQAANQVAERLENLDLYKTDYSDLI